MARFDTPYDIAGNLIKSSVKVISNIKRESFH